MTAEERASEVLFGDKDFHLEHDNAEGWQDFEYSLDGGATTYTALVARLREEGHYRTMNGELPQ